MSLLSAPGPEAARSRRVPGPASVDAPAEQAPARGAASWTRRLVLERLARIETGRLAVRDALGDSTFGSEDGGPAGQVVVHQPRFYRRLALHGGLGAAESYLDGDWDTPCLPETLQVLAANLEVLQRVESGLPRLLGPFRTALSWLRRNTLSGSRRNIAAHYDLSNEFFESMLDPTMTYSSGYFPYPGASLEEAQREKYDRLCRKLRLAAGDHVLEIGTGWGGFASHAAREYGCRVTTTTISRAQHDYAAERLRRDRVADRVTLLLEDYRHLRGAYDKLVSIEMIEAVGERYLPTYFGQCSRLLKPNGAMALQAITIPDCRYERYRHGVDFIQKHVFPGGFLPSPGAITTCLASDTDFRVAHVEDFADHYARTLAAWRDNYRRRLDRLPSLGFDQRFHRTWEYYLAYCEAGFRERQIGVSQWVLAKPQWRGDQSPAVG